ncbi:glutamate receptor ionotropic, delta-1-like [Centruroides sculpturatus]|uniref:glutamate receptor ionotropic, delta-1-like n=1 Tax=Centruroides sculpturatus TaxID=218467 RepID=UPI000C6DCEDF|nr:glutamate receptor ionotropic, delta-1-like [Centruroides sculpturatus]
MNLVQINDHHLDDKIYEIIEPVEKVFGIKLDNGSWNGLIGRIQRKEADVSAISLYVTYDRFQVVKLTACVSGSRVLFVVSRPKQLSKLTTIIRPFSFEVRSEINQDKCTSSRIVIGIWLLMTTVLISAYSGVLFSYMTYPAYEKVPTTIEELSNAVKNHEYSCGTLSISAIKSMMMNAPKGMVSILGDYIRKNPDKSFPTINEGIEYTLQYKHAHILPEGIINFLPIGQKGVLVISEDSFLTYTTVFPMKKQFQFEKTFNKRISRLRDNGIYQKLKQNDMPAEGSSNKETYYSLSIEDISSALILLLCGYSISVIILLVEKLLKRK